MTAGLRITAGGAPRPREAAALAAAFAALIDAERAGAAPADPRPAVYRSRWRRAAALDGVHDTRDLRDPGPAWMG